MSEVKLEDVRVCIGWVIGVPTPVFTCAERAFKTLGVNYNSTTITGEQFNHLWDLREKFRKALREYERFASTCLTGHEYDEETPLDR
jgi:hypothetical protein